jgi:hypothetical protein
MTTDWNRVLATHGLGGTLMIAFSFVLRPIHTRRVSPPYLGVFEIFGRAGGFKGRSLHEMVVALGMSLRPGGVLKFVLNSGDRFVMQSTRGAAELSLNVLSYKIGRLGFMFVLTPFLKIWGAVVVRIAVAVLNGILLPASGYAFVASPSEREVARQAVRKVTPWHRVRVAVTAALLGVEA